MDQTKRICKFCNKEVINLPNHIIRIHPAVYEQLDETGLENEKTPVVTPVSSNLPVKNIQTGDLNALIREKLEIMFNIMIMERLAANPKTSINELNQMLNPPKQSTLQEIKEYHDLIYPKEMPVIETGNQWLDVAQQALPIVRDMMQSRKPKQESDLDVRAGESPNSAILKPIQFETAGDPTKPSDPK